jgi:hypothetical protein
MPHPKGLRETFLKLSGDRPADNLPTGPRWRAKEQLTTERFPEIQRGRTMILVALVIVVALTFGGLVLGAWLTGFIPGTHTGSPK